MLYTKLVTAVLVIALRSSCYTQEIEGTGKSGGPVFSPASYAELSVPVTSTVGINAYGFYLGNVDAGIALIEAPLRVHSHLSITPSYLFVRVSSGGLSVLTQHPASSSYNEHQLRLAATFSTKWHGWLFLERNMYARRFTPNGDLNRYRNRVYVAHPVRIGILQPNLFAFDEIYHDFAPGPWVRRNWVVGGADIPITKRLTFQPSFIRQDDSYLRSINFLGLGLIIRTPQFLLKKGSTP